MFFALFVVSGIRSFLKAKKQKEKAIEEKEKIEKIVTFLKDAASKGAFMVKATDVSMEEESLIISNMAVAEVEKNFDDLEPGISYYVVDRFYSDIFETDED